MRHFYESIRNPWIMNIVSGAVLAVTIFIFPVLYGEGYDVIGKVINMTVESPFTKSLLFGVVPGKIALIVVLGGVMLAKCFACSASNCGGGVAGDFAPTLFAGCIAGLFFALVVNPFFDFDMKPQVFAYLGMAGVMAGVIRAPLMALFITAEMCNGFDYFLPLTIVSVISYAIVMVITKRKFYEVHFHFHIHHNH